MSNGFGSFFERYWILIVAFIALFGISRTDTAFSIFGTLVHLPVLSLGAILTALGIRHVFFKQTLDQDAHSGWFVEAWRKLPDDQRIFFNLGTIAALFLGICKIAAAMIR